ncbi:MAG: D-tyrosyl-tRNA(Tyr) deacylase [Candidatus Hydrogenedentota bacterium]|nr:MAG: D-tyrosyl-tRNA(Tyr) deacylase [Candidatus Hydrogenedentota bacterium]
MRCVIQRVSSASVSVRGEVIAEIGRGILLLAGCARSDTEEVFRWMARKVANLRIFPPAPGEPGGHFEKSVMEIGGEILVVSQFTLFGDARKGRRPSFSEAMPVEEAREAFPRFVKILREESGVRVVTGRFQEMMDVKLTNEGPVTIILDRPEKTMEGAKR